MKEGLLQYQDVFWYSGLAECRELCKERFVICSLFLFETSPILKSMDQTSFHLETLSKIQSTNTELAVQWHCIGWVMLGL